MTDFEPTVLEVEAAVKKLQAVTASVEKVIYGQGRVIEETLVSVLSGGHALLIGVPGLGKTKLVQTLGTVLGLDASRVQFTPDLMPGDILGSEVLEQSEDGKRSFRYIKGPVFCQLLMADEINRASPRTQSALLQAMQEQEVTVAGHHHLLPRPFHVLATQNPLEQEGTYPLPEAQLDRFLLQIDIEYPDYEAEKTILMETTGDQEATAGRVLTAAELIQIQRLARRLPVGENVMDGILKLVRAGRPEDSPLEIVQQHVAWGPGPRASQALILAAKSRAMLQGRLTPTLDDVFAMAAPVLKHRMALSFTARAEGVTFEQVLGDLRAFAD